MALPEPPEDLCFSTSTLIEKEFNVDEFVSAIRKRVTIECLREDLDSYFRTLKNAMVELINKDYADFVALSANLVSCVEWAFNTKSAFGNRGCGVLRVSKRCTPKRATPTSLSMLLQVGMDKSISSLMTPLSQLQEEIMVNFVQL